MNTPKHAEGRNFHDYYNTTDIRKSDARCNSCWRFTTHRLMVMREKGLWPMAMCGVCYQLGLR